MQRKREGWEGEEERKGERGEKDRGMLGIKREIAPTVTAKSWRR